MTSTRQILGPVEPGKVEYVYGMTRTGEAIHAVPHISAKYSAKPMTRCGLRVKSMFGPKFGGAEGVQHPFRCYKCHDGIKRDDAEREQARAAVAEPEATR